MQCTAFDRVFSCVAMDRDGASGYELTAPPIYDRVESGDSWKDSEDQVFWCPSNVFKKLYTLLSPC